MGGRIAHPRRCAERSTATAAEAATGLRPLTVLPIAGPAEAARRKEARYRKIS